MDRYTKWLRSDSILHFILFVSVTFSLFFSCAMRALTETVTDTGIGVGLDLFPSHFATIWCNGPFLHVTFLNRGKMNSYWDIHSSLIVIGYSLKRSWQIFVARPRRRLNLENGETREDFRDS